MIKFDQQLFSLQNLIKNILENFIHHSRLRTCWRYRWINNNLQFVEHNVEEEVDGVKAEIQIKFNIFESEKVVVERVNVVGNNVTNESVIRGELLLDEGDPFTKLRLDNTISKLKSRRLFKDVSGKVTDGSEKNLKVVEIKVEEQPTGELSAGAGVGTNGGSFAFNITENNWLAKEKN